MIRHVHARHTPRLVAACCALVAGTALAQAGSASARSTAAQGQAQPTLVPQGNLQAPDLTMQHAWPVGGSEGLPNTGSCQRNAATGQMSVWSMVRNMGPLPTGPITVKVRFNANGQEMMWQHAGLGPNQGVPVGPIAIPAAAWGPSLAQFTITADPGNTVQEMNESNNSLTSHCLKPAG
jgi:hypothetical protein